MLEEEVLKAGVSLHARGVVVNRIVLDELLGIATWPRVRIAPMIMIADAKDIDRSILIRIEHKETTNVT